MTIQISVVIWTILCFLALYLVLKYLLFVPVLSLMDKRQEKIDAAKKRTEAERERLEQERLHAQLELEDMIRRAGDEAKAEAENVRMEGKRLLEEAKKDRITIVEEHRVKTDAEYGEDMEKASQMVNGSAELFLSRLFAN